MDGAAAQQTTVFAEPGETRLHSKIDGQQTHVKSLRKSGLAHAVVEHDWNFDVLRFQRDALLLRLRDLQADVDFGRGVFRSF